MKTKLAITFLVATFISGCCSTETVRETAQIQVKPQVVHDTLYLPPVNVPIAPDNVTKPICDSLIQSAVIDATNWISERKNAEGDALRSEMEGWINKANVLQRKLSQSIQPKDTVVAFEYVRSEVRPFTLKEKFYMVVGQFSTPLWIAGLLILGIYLFKDKIMQFLSPVTAILSKFK